MVCLLQKQQQKTKTYTTHHKEIVLDFNFAVFLSPSLLHRNVPEILEKAAQNVSEIYKKGW